MEHSNSMVKLKYYFDFLWVMTEKELKARYKNTVFGFLWSFINPLLQMLVIGFVFRFFIKEPINNYFWYLLVGLLVWNFFSLSLTKATPSILSERSLIKKAAFPREVIPLSIIFSNFINMLISFAIALVPVIYVGSYSVLGIPGLIIGLLLLLFFTVGFSFLTSAYNVRYRDINFFVQALLIIWFYATPIVYSVSFIPHRLIWLWRLNPLVVIVQLFQNALVSAPAPGIGMFLENTLITVAVFVLGIYVFKSESKNFDDWL
jgi:ABC-type polysaccharide/polyol phosphate export permease